MTYQPLTLAEKVWRDHIVAAGENGGPDLLYIDLHLVHEVTSPQAFSELRARSLRVRQPERTVATMDHAIPTRLGPDGRRAAAEGAAAVALKKEDQDPSKPGPRIGVRAPGEEPDAPTSFRALDVEQYRKAADRLFQADLDLIEARSQPADAPGAGEASSPAAKPAPSMSLVGLFKSSSMDDVPDEDVDWDNLPEVSRPRAGARAG